MRFSKWPIVASLLGALFQLPALADPVRIDYELVSLGGVHYEYRYTVTNESFVGDFYGFSIDLDLAVDGSETTPNATVGTWQTSILSAVLGNPAQYDALNTGAALGVGDSATGFIVRFDWDGTGTLGPQAFVLYDSNFELVGNGYTTLLGGPPPGEAPEPATLALALLALAGAGVSRRAWRS